jgi:hypothetical protein
MSYKGKDPLDPEHRPPVGSLGPPLCIFTFSIINKRQVPHSLSLQVYHINDLTWQSTRKILQTAANAQYTTTQHHEYNILTTASE